MSRLNSRTAADQEILFDEGFVDFAGNMSFEEDVDYDCEECWWIDLIVCAPRQCPPLQQRRLSQQLGARCALIPGAMLQEQTRLGLRRPLGKGLRGQEQHRAVRCRLQSQDLDLFEVRSEYDERGLPLDGAAGASAVLVETGGSATSSISARIATDKNSSICSHQSASQGS
jgi:hypothetical protein